VCGDEERGGALAKDEPVVVHCYIRPVDIEDAANLAELGSFCRRMETRGSPRRSRLGDRGRVLRHPLLRRGVEDEDGARYGQDRRGAWSPALGAGLDGVGELARFVKMNPSRLRLRYTELYTESVFWDTEFTKIHQYSAEENARNILKEDN
jgi:hypothetical protein